MATQELFNTLVPSESTDGAPIDVVATASPGTLIHTATSDPTESDKPILYAWTQGAAAIDLTLEIGATERFTITLTPKQPKRLIWEGEPLNGGVLIRAFAANANEVKIAGEIIRVGPRT